MAAVAPDAPCPEPAALWAAASGDATPEQLRRLVAHANRCPTCGENWRLARFLARSPQAPKPGDPAFSAASLLAAKRSSDGPVDASLLTNTPLRGLAVAVLLAVLALGLLWVILAPRLQDSVLRPATTDEIESLTPSDLPLSHDDVLLRWRGPEGARYRLVVTTETSRVLVREDLGEATDYVLPLDVVETPPEDRLLLWQLEATFEDGTHHVSPSFRVRLESDR